LDGSFVLNDANGAPITLRVGNNNADSNMSYLTGSGTLEKIGTGTLNYAADFPVNYPDTFTGDTIISAGSILLGGNNGNPSTFVVSVDGGLKFHSYGAGFHVGGLSGSGKLSLKNSQGGAANLIVGSNNADTTYSGVISGPTLPQTTVYGTGLTKVGTGTLTLTAANSFGVLSVNGGTLKVTGSLAKNSSAYVFVASGTDFHSASLFRRIQPGSSISGYGSATQNGSIFMDPPLSADIRTGVSNLAAATDLAMQWRVPNVSDPSNLADDVLNLSGMSSTPGVHPQTDPFVLQMRYNQNLLGGDESLIAANGLLNLVWLDPDFNQRNGLWVNATAGNFGTGLPGEVFQNYQGSWDAFAAAHGVTDANVGNFLGSYGVDTATHTVWAVVNFNGQFSVVPEPATLLLLGMGSAMLFGVLATRKYRRRSAVLLTALPAALLGVVGVFPSLALAGTWIDTTSGGGWSNKNNWAGGAVPYGPDQVADFSTLDITSDNTVFLDSYSPLVGTLKFGDVSPSNNWALSTDGGYTFGLATTTGSPIVEVDNQSATITASLTGTQGFTKTGAGRLVLPNAARLVSGPITISAGVVEVGKNASANTFAVNVDGGLAFGPLLSTCTLGGLTGSGNVSLTNASGGPVTLTVGGADGTYSGAFSGGGSLGWAGPGNLTLAGDNTFNGDLAVGGGGLILTNENAPGSATLYHGTMTLTAAGSINAPVTVIGGTIQLNNANGLQNDTIDVNASNAISFGPGIASFTIGGLTRTRSNGSITLTDTSGAPVTLRVGANNGSTSFKGLIKGKGTLVKVGTGTLTMDLLNSASSFGALDIESGILSVTDGPTSVNQVTVNGGTLLFNGGGFSGPITVNADGGLAFSPSVTAVSRGRTPCTSTRLTARRQ
jgi:fibronectin-binding autotransporter adhesin